MENVKEIVRFDLEFQWRLYLSRVNLKEDQLPEDQQREMKRVFYGGFGQMLMVFANDITRLPEGQISEAFDYMVEQVNDFWKVQQ